MAALTVSEPRMTMEDAMTERIIIDSMICHGKPVVKGTRTPVTIILDALAAGDTFEMIQADYDITAEDIRACIATPQCHGAWCRTHFA